MCSNESLHDAVYWVWITIIMCASATQEMNRRVFNWFCFNSEVIGCSNESGTADRRNADDRREAIHPNYVEAIIVLIKPKMSRASREWRTEGTPMTRRSVAYADENSNSSFCKLEQKIIVKEKNKRID